MLLVHLQSLWTSEDGDLVELPRSLTLSRPLRVAHHLPQGFTVWQLVSEPALCSELRSPVDAEPWSLPTLQQVPLVLCGFLRSRKCFLAPQPLPAGQGPLGQYLGHGLCGPQPIQVWWETSLPPTYFHPTTSLISENGTPTEYILALPQSPFLYPHVQAPSAATSRAQ